MIYYGIALVVFLLDRISKMLVLQYMELGQSIPLIEGIFHLTSHRNRGAAFGILQNQRIFFIIMTIIIVIVLIWYIWRIHKKRPLLSWALALILGGALGNFYDRVTTGEVVDFFDFALINFPIFNVGDTAIVVGACLFLFEEIRGSAKEKQEKSHES